jgi:hypothetical protein
MSSLFSKKAAPISDPEFHNELDIESMISAPLVAASKANVVMLTGQKRFILEYCFRENDKGQLQPVMIEMVITKVVMDEGDSKVTYDPKVPPKMKQVQFSFSIPLLCLVPFNSLAVDKVTVDFDMEITSISKKQPVGSKSGNTENTQIVDDKVQLNGKISNDRRRRDSDKAETSSQMKSKLSVHINASTLPLPVGVLTILDMYTKAIHALPMEDTSTTPTKDENTKRIE